jgi:WD40 repeat protein
VSGGSDGPIFVWDLRSTLPFKPPLIIFLQLRECEISNHNNNNDIPHVWCVAYRCLFALEGHEGGVNTLQFDTDKIISGGEDKLVKIWRFVP